MALESKGRAPQCQCVTQGTGTTDGAVVLLGAGVFKQPCFPLKVLLIFRTLTLIPSIPQKIRLRCKELGGDLEIKRKVYLNTNFLLKI